MKCKRCDKEVQELTPGGFCSRSCSNKRIHSEETKNKIRKTLLSKGNLLSENGKKGSKSLWSNPEYRARFDTRVHILGFDNISVGAKRLWIIKEQQGRCNRCGISEWNSSPITLEMDHIDGNSKNNERTNLECLCPNCHSQTPTWRGKNVKGRPKSCWINNGEKELLILVDELDQWIQRGYIKGRFISWKRSSQSGRAIEAPLS